MPHPRRRKEISNKEGNLEGFKIHFCGSRRSVDSVSLLNKKRRFCAVPRTAARDRELRV